MRVSLIRRNKIRTVSVIRKKEGWSIAVLVYTLKNGKCSVVTTDGLKGTMAGRGGKKALAVSQSVPVNTLETSCRYQGSISDHGRYNNNEAASLVEAVAGRPKVKVSDAVLMKCAGGLGVLEVLGGCCCGFDVACIRDAYWSVLGNAGFQSVWTVNLWRGTVCGLQQGVPVSSHRHSQAEA